MNINRGCQMIRTLFLSSLLFVTVPLADSLAWYDPDSRVDFDRIDRIAVNTPESREKDIETLAAYFRSHHGGSELFAARLICRWIAENVSYDAEKLKRGNLKKNKTAEEVFEARKCVCGGYANLFVRLAELVGLEAVRVTGYSKAYGYSPGEDVRENLHAWNAVRIKGRWYLLDPTWASGYITDDDKFVRRFNEFYFITSPETLILTHFPKDPAHQLLRPPVSMKQFENFVYLRPRFFRYGIAIDSHRRGLIKTRSEVEITFDADNRTSFAASLSRNGKKLPDTTVFIQNPDGHVQLNAVFPEPGKYNLDIYAKKGEEKGGYKHVALYKVAASEGKGKRFGFPRIYRGFAAHKCRLVVPMNRYLKAGRQHDFKIRVPDATRVAVVVGENDWKSLTRGLYFHGSVKVPEGKVSVIAKFPGSRTYQTVVEYEGY